MGGRRFLLFRGPFRLKKTKLILDLCSFGFFLLATHRAPPILDYLLTETFVLLRDLFTLRLGVRWSRVCRRMCRCRRRSLFYNGMR